MKKRDRAIKPERALEVLSKLLKDNCVKRVAHEEKLAPSTVYDVRKRFPLFFWNARKGL